MGALAASVLAALVLCGLGQAAMESSGGSAGGRALGALVLACAVALLAAAFTLRPATVASMNLAVIVLAYFALACTLATLTVQERDYRGRSEEQLWEAFQVAEAGLFHRILHPRQPRPAKELSPKAEAHFVEMGKKLGADYATKQRKMHVRGQQAKARSDAAAAWGQEHERFLRGLFRFMRATRLSNAYSAWWFIAILALLVVNLSACAFRRLQFTSDSLDSIAAHVGVYLAIARPFVGLRLTPANLGFAATHLGLIVLLIGVCIGKATKTTGAFALVVGGRDQTSKFFDAGSGKAVPFGFSVKLEAFRTDYHKELMVAFVDSDQETIQFERRFKAEHGLKHELDEGRVNFAISETMAEAVFRQNLVDDPNGRPNPAAQVVVIRSEDDVNMKFLFALDDHTLVHPSNQIKVRYAGSMPAQEAEQIAQQAATGSIGIITVKDQTTGRSASLDARVGQTLDFGGYRLEVAECYADFSRRDTLPLSLQYPNRPAARLSVTKGKDTESRWVFQGMDYDAMHAKGRPAKSKSLKFALRFDPWLSPSEHKILLANVGEELMAYPISEDGVGEARPIEVGKPEQVPGTPFELMVAKVCERAKLQSRVEAYEPGPDHDPFLSPAQPAIKLQVKSPSGEHSQWLVANSEQQFLEIPGGPAFAYMDNTEKKPIAWVAKLGFYEEGEKQATRIVKVNHPAKFRGFFLYQEDANAKNPNYAGIRAVRDPGWPVVKTGLTMVILGIVYMFYVKPFVGSKRPKAGLARNPPAGGHAAAGDEQSSVELSRRTADVSRPGCGRPCWVSIRHFVPLDRRTRLLALRNSSRRLRH